MSAALDLLMADTISIPSGDTPDLVYFLPAGIPKRWRGEVRNWFDFMPVEHHGRLQAALEHSCTYGASRGEDEAKIVRRMTESLRAIHRDLPKGSSAWCCIRDFIACADSLTADPAPPRPLRIPPEFPSGEAFAAFLDSIAKPLAARLAAVPDDDELDDEFGRVARETQIEFEAKIRAACKGLQRHDVKRLIEIVDTPELWLSSRVVPPPSPPSGSITSPAAAPKALPQSAAKTPPKAGKGPLPRKPIDWRALDGRSPPKREWVIDDWLIPGPNLFVGMGGIGKTQLAQQGGTCLAVGKDFIGRVARPCRVLMWACEDDENELWRRQDAICRHYDVPIADLADNLIIMPRLGMDNTLYTTEFGKPMFSPGIAELEEQINDYAADVVLLDNIGQIYGANENDRHSVTKFVNGLIGACKGRPVAVVLLGHPARSSGSEFAGSGAWENAVRMRWLLSSRLPDSPDPDRDEAPDDAVRYLSKRKANYSGKDFRQFTFRDGVLALDADPAAAGGVTGFARRKQAERVVLEGVVRLSAMAVHVSDRNGARNFAPSVILQYKLSEGLTKRELGDAMRNLMLDGKLARGVVGHYSNRSEQFGLVVVL